MISKCAHCSKKLKRREERLYTDKNHNTMILCPICLEEIKNSK